MNHQRWIALHCGEETNALIKKHPNAFLLLTQISIRAKWKDCKISNLKMGQSWIGDYKAAGLKSPRAYRHAQTVLKKIGIVAFTGTNKGTIATLMDSSIFSLSQVSRGILDDEQRANKRQADDEQRANKKQAGDEQRATNHTETKIDRNTEINFEGNSTIESTKIAELIYQKYPRKAAKAEALKAIARAMKKHDSMWLLEKVDTYAKTITWQDRNFIPYPATWFSQERYNDDPEEWKLPTNAPLKAVLNPSETRKGHEICI